MVFSRAGKIKTYFFEEIFSSKLLIWTIAFGICFLIFEWVALPNSLVDLDVWGKHIKHGSYFRLLIVLGLSTFALVLFLAFIYAALASSRVYQVIYFSVFSFLVATEYGYYNAIGQFFEIHEMEVALLATNAEIIANAATIYFSYLALVPILGFGVLLLIAPRVIERGFIPLSAIILSLGLFFFATTYLTKNTFYVHSFNHAIRTIVTLPVIWYLEPVITRRRVFITTRRALRSIGVVNRNPKTISFLSLMNLCAQII